MRWITIFGAATLGLANAPAGAPLSVEITGLKPGRGQVMVGVCLKNEFLSPRCTFQTALPVGSSSTVVVVAPDLRPARYAVQVVYDLNRNLRMDTDTYGVPTEPVAFSRNPTATNGPPKFEDAAFDFASAAKVMIRLK